MAASHRPRRRSDISFGGPAAALTAAPLKSSAAGEGEGAGAGTSMGPRRDPFREMIIAPLNPACAAAQPSPTAAAAAPDDRRARAGRRPATPERSARRPRRSSLQVSKGGVNAFYPGTSSPPIFFMLLFGRAKNVGFADSQDMSSNGYSSSPGGRRPSTPHRILLGTCSTPHYTVNPTSSLLQNLIKEQRAARDANCSQPSTPVDYAQSMTASEKNGKLRAALAAGLKESTEMGVREMDQYVSKINKEIFDLKLEVVHRAKQADVMKRKLERMDQLETRIKQLEAAESELQDANDRLQEDLDKRNRGLVEAVGLICDLERKIEELSFHCEEDISPSIEEPDDVHTPTHPPMIEVPDRSSSRKGTMSARARRSRVLLPRRTRRQPSFLQDQSESTSALRSLYLEDANKSQAFSIFSGNESEELESPRLSALSECSDLDTSFGLMMPTRPEESDSIHDESASMPAPDLPTAVPDEDIGRKFSRIEDWIPSSAPIRDASITPEHDTPDTPTISRKKPILGAAFEARRTTKSSMLEKPRNRPTYATRLPPTPDTMSTSFIDPRNRSNPSIIEERSRYGRGGAFTSLTSDESLARPTSPGNMTRPNTGDTALNDDPDPWNRHHAGANGNAHLHSIFPGAGRGRHASEPPADIFHLHRAEPGAGDSNRLWADENDSPYKVRPVNRASICALSDLSHNRSSSNSDALSPQDWLDAALPIANDTTAAQTRGKPTIRKVNDPALELNPHEPDQPEAELPTQPITPARHGASRAPNAQEAPARRGLSFRLFSRSKAHNAPASDPVGAKPPAASSSSSSPKTASNNLPFRRRSSMKAKPSSTTTTTTTPRTPAPRPLSTYSIPGPAHALDLRAANSLESIKHARRGSSGGGGGGRLFSWLKVPKAGTTLEKNPAARVVSQPVTRPHSAWDFAPDSTSPASSPARQASSLGYRLADRSAESVAAQGKTQQQQQHPLSGQLA
ncbi:hypothetical protein LOY94_002821 [Ophidiomyces ophidiicola]|nr:hypothetical protein LOZ47_000132 [Ophidiomyces ophidiicola]KAI2050473.1 hypothetical protein LOZ38_003263 [Ophidiomyces ophidiicola]KAI2107304.1 hypothetical protein LOZ34_002770 [Ophidiomyces ophidiicola]KAI2119915.1 hypothetical protein LOZ42_001572 [Ophidiomyces ophidiicola]KAI2120618.1 hypothetical protein LOZ32_002603 [Ophidiomyces ophidiicola]